MIDRTGRGVRCGGDGGTLQCLHFNIMSAVRLRTTSALTSIDGFWGHYACFSDRGVHSLPRWKSPYIYLTRVSLEQKINPASQEFRVPKKTRRDWGQQQTPIPVQIQSATTRIYRSSLCSHQASRLISEPAKMGVIPQTLLGGK